MTDLDNLESKAKAATPGPWQYDGVNVTQAVNDGTGLADVITTDDADEGRIITDADAAYIAAASPDVVLSLIARVRDAEAQAKRVRAVLDDVSERVRHMGHDWLAEYADETLAAIAAEVRRG